MNPKAKSTIGLVLLATAGYTAAVWWITEYFTHETRSADLMLETVLDSKLGGKETDKVARKFEIQLRRGKDPTIQAMLRRLGDKTSGSDSSCAPCSDTLPLTELQDFRAGKIAKDSLRAFLLHTPTDSVRFVVPLYWAWAGLGQFSAGAGSDSAARAQLKSLGKRLHQHDLPFLAAEVFATCMRQDSVGATDPELEAWYGSALTKRALFVESSLDKIAMVKEGVKHLDKAAFDHPDFAAIRIIRASTYAALPSIFNKKSLLRGDLEFLLDHYEGNLPLRYWWAGKVVERLADAQQLSALLERAKGMFSDDKVFFARIEQDLSKMGKK